LCPRFLHGFTRDASFVVLARGIAETILEEGKHGLKHTRIERGGCGMIEVDAP
jgi:hypothetical protein